MKRHVGMDLHKRLLVVCVLDESGQTVREHKVEPVTRATVEGFCKRHLSPEDEVVLEATTHVWAVVRIVEKHVSRVVVSNPIATKAIASAKVKTDKVDARVLAQLLRLGFLPSVWQPDAELSKLRELASRRSRLVSQRTAIINRIRTTLAMRLLDCPYAIPDKSGRQWLASAELDEDGRFLIDSDLRLLDGLRDEIDLLDKRMAQRVCQDPRVRLLMTLPGVGVQVAISLVAAIGDITRFAEADKLASYLGLVPSTRQSANKCFHGPITKAGRSHTRWMLIEAAHTAARDPGPLGHFFNKVRRRKNYNVAVVAIARKLALLAWHLLTSGRPYRYAKPASVEAKLSTLRVAGTGVRRKGGLGPGVDARVVRPASEQNQRRTGSLAQILEKEQVPAPDDLKPGERKMLEAIDKLAYYESLQHPSARPRSKGRATRSEMDKALS